MTGRKDSNMQASPRIEFERDPYIAADLDCAWTSALVIGDDVIDMTAIGDPENDGLRRAT